MLLCHTLNLLLLASVYLVYGHLVELEGVGDRCRLLVTLPTRREFEFTPGIKGFYTVVVQVATTLIFFHREAVN